MLLVVTLGVCLPPPHFISLESPEPQRDVSDESQLLKAKATEEAMASAHTFPGVRKRQSGF